MDYLLLGGREHAVHLMGVAGVSFQRHRARRILQPLCVFDWPGSVCSAAASPTQPSAGRV